jgi:hypothetical protein
LRCIATEGKNFLYQAIENSTSASVNGFINAITNGCSSDDFSMVLSGGYDNEVEQLGIHMVLEINARSNL